MINLNLVNIIVLKKHMYLKFIHFKALKNIPKNIKKVLYIPI